MSALMNKLALHNFPHLSDRLRYVLAYVLGEEVDGAAVKCVTLEHGEVRAYLDGIAAELRLGEEADLATQLRRLIRLARLDPEEQAAFESLLFDKIGLLISARFGCHGPQA